MGKKSRNKNKKDNSAPCDCPGCLISRMADEIQNCLLTMAGVEAQFNPGDPDPRFLEIRDSVLALGEDILSNLANFQAQNEIGVPFYEGTPEFMAIMAGKKYH